MDKKAFLMDEDYEFVQYLDSHNVLNSLNHVLVSLYQNPSWPANPLMFLVNKFCMLAHCDSYDKVKSELEEIKMQINHFELENEQLKNIIDRNKSQNH